jgi:hypothetical protein
LQNASAMRIIASRWRTCGSTFISMTLKIDVPGSSLTHRDGICARGQRLSPHVGEQSRDFVLIDLV